MNELEDAKYENNCKRHYVVWFHSSEILTISKFIDPRSRLVVNRGYQKRRMGRDH